jgi:hypothetical protein
MLAGYATLRATLKLQIVALGFAAIAVHAADPFYLGTWKIASAVVAPWADPKNLRGDTAEMKGLVGKTILIAMNEISGPRGFACRAPRYELVDYTADMLFQGEFGEMRLRDKAVDPAKLAAKLGFRGAKWKTLETGCGNEIDYHFVDETTAEFGLNDYVYTLKKR